MPFNNWAQIHFGFYKLFNDPPGTPKELKCVGCKITTAGLSFVMAGIFGVVGAKKSIHNVYTGLSFGLVAVTLAASGVTFSRMAYDDNQYNQSLIKSYRKELGELRRTKSKEINNHTM